MTIFIVVALAVGVAFWYSRSIGTQFPALRFADDDPELQAAKQQARDSVGEFVELYKKYPNGAGVKVPFVSSSGAKENLAADVLAINGSQIHVRLTSEPVTHTGPLEQLQTYDLQDIVDWIVVLPGNKRMGGFTMRVMFKKARAEWGKLPTALAEEEKNYLP